MAEALAASEVSEVILLIRRRLEIRALQNSTMSGKRSVRLSTKTNVLSTTGKNKSFNYILKILL